MSDDTEDLGDRLRRLGFRARKDAIAAFLAHVHKSRIGPTETIEQLVDLDPLLRASDVVSVQASLTPATHHLIGARELALMRPDAYLVNTARGPLVDEASLREALDRGRIAGAALDVWEEEPTPADNPLLKLDNVVLTPHYICATDECMATVAASVFNACKDLAQGRVPRNVVNQQVLGRVPYFHA